MRKKKILASMLMAPMAFAAYADVTVATPSDASGWTTVSGVSDALQWSNNGMTCPVGVASIQTSFKLQPGKYKMAFGTLNNAKVTVTVNGQEVASYSEFTVEGDALVTENNVTVKIDAIDASQGFGYQDMTLTLDFNFDEAKAALQALLPSAESVTALADPKADQTERDAILAEIEDIQANIDKLASAPTLDTYAAFKLWGYADAKDSISEAIAALNDKIATFNEAAAKANHQYANEQLKATLENAATEAQAKLDALKDAIAAVEDDEKTVDVNEKDYVDGKTAAEVEAALAAIEAYKEAVKAFFTENADKLDSENLTFEDTEGLGAAMTTTYDAAKNAFDGAQADIAAYNEFNQYVAEKLTPAFQQAQTSIAGANAKALKGYTFRGETPETPSKIEAANQAVQKLYNDNKTLALDGAAAALADAKTAVDNAITAMGTQATDINTLVDDQNTLMGTLIEKINEAETQIKAENDKDINNEGINALIAAAQEALKKLQTSSRTAYETLELPADTEADVTALNTALENLKDGVQTFDDNTATVADLQKALDDAKKVINGDPDDQENFPGYEKEVQNRMATTIANIQNSINAIDVNDENLDVTDITNGIQDLLDTAQKLNDALSTVKEGVKAYTDYLAEIDKLATDKLLLKGDPDALGEAYDEFKAAVEKFKAAVEKFTADETAALGQEDDQACYAALKALADQWTNTDKATAETDATAIMQAFDQAGTQSNIDFVNAAKDALDKYVEGLTLNADATATVSDILAGYDSEIAQAQTDLAAAVAADYDHAKYNAVDKALQALNRKISTFKDQLEAYISVDMTKLSDLLAACNALNADYDGNEENGAVPTLEPAHGYWDNLLNGSDDKSYQSRIDALQAALDAALAKDNVDNKLPDFKKTYDTIKAGLENVHKNIPANEIAHNDFLTTSDNLRTLISGYIAEINGRQADVAGVTELENLLNEYVACLQALLDTHANTTEEPYSNVAAVDAQVYGSYKVGEVGTESKMDEYSNAYAEIEKAAKAIYSDFSAHFNEEIAAANDALINNADWTDLLAELKAEYAKDVKAYNLYMYGLHNPGYKDKVQEDLANFHDIYDSNTAIDELKAAFEQYVKEKNEANHAITATEFAEKATTPAQELLDAMKARVAAMEAAVFNTAVTYYAENEPEAAAAVKDAKTDLANIGVTDEGIVAKAIKDQKEALEAAQTTNGLFYDENDQFHQPAELAPYAKEMDNIADNLDKALKPVNYDLAANEQWTKDLQDAQATIDGYTKDVEGFEFVNKDAWEAALEQAEEAKGNLPASSDKDTLKDNQTDLADILAALEGAYNNIKNANDNAQAAKDAYDGYTGDLADMQGLADDLREFVNSLAAGNDSMLEPVDAALQVYSDYIEANKNNLQNLTADVEALAADVQAAIENGYGSAMTQESALLGSWMKTLKGAFNDAMVNAPLSDADAASYQKTIDDLVADIAALPDFTTGMTAEEYAAFKAAAVAAEKTISDTYQALQASWSKDSHDSENPLPNPADTANGDIAVAQKAAQSALVTYNALLAEAEEYADYFAEGAFDNFKTQAGEYAQELEAIAGAVEVEGNNVILTSDRYINDYNGVKSDIEGKTSDLQTALDKAKAAKEFQDQVNTAYNGYATQIADVQAEFDALKEKIAGYGEVIESTIKAYGYYSSIESYLDEAQTKLDNAKENNPSSLIDGTFEKNFYKLLYAQHYIGKAACRGAELTINAPATEAADAVQAANDFLRDNNIVPEAAAALSQAIKDAGTEIASLEDRRANAWGNFSTYDEIEDEFLAIAEAYKTIKTNLENAVAAAQENIFVPGDVCGAEGLTDGKVNTLDVQTLIYWVGQGMTYQELYEENPVIACAADVMNDNLLNIGDITKVIRLAMGMDDSDQPAGVRGVEYGAGLLSLQVLSSANGLTTYAVNVNSQTHFIGGQLDLLIPAGCEIVDTRLVSGTHNLYRFDNAEGVRFVIASMENAELVLDGDCVMTVTVRGEAPIAPKAGTFADSRCFSHEMLVNGGNASGIEGIEDGDGSMMQQIYDAYGRTLRALKRGINIIRHSDGSVTKEYRK